jgi:hypothetical protein
LLAATTIKEKWWRPPNSKSWLGKSLVAATKRKEKEDNNQDCN